jgi:hypothetical protein
MKKTIFIFNVELHWETTVTRKIAIRGDQTLEDLHFAIYDAFDREEEHLYSFYFPKPGSRGRARIRDALEYTCPYCLEEGNCFGDEPAKDAAETAIESLPLRPRQKFSYLFDFGDEWWHDISVEQVNVPSEKGKYPRVLEKHGKSPPQYPDYDDEECEEENDEESE